MNKVKFQDQESDDYLLENSVLKSKLQSKVEALTIMSRELDKCSMERDRFRLLVEQFKLKKNVISHNYDGLYPYQLTTNKTVSGGELLAFTREENNILKLEVESLRTKLEDATGDIDALRKQLQFSERNSTTANISDLQQYSDKDYESLVQDLERTQKKYQQLMHDYQSILDEKEELVADRDYYKNKVFRLNHQISLILTNRVNKQQSDEETLAPKLMIDIDAMVAENKYLQERITQLQVEKEIAKRNLSKYKSLLENRSKTSTNNFKMGIIDVMTQKQVKDFLDQNLKSGLKRTSISDLKSLCMGLFEALSDKSIALQHQRKTNQILANRITELEKTLESWCNGEKYVPVFPSQILLDEFVSEPENSKIDSDKKSDIHIIQDDIENKEIRLDCIHEKNEHSEMIEAKDFYCEDGEHKTRGIKKTVLPFELEELVREALAELKPSE
ncbi:Coiled-coil domain-containing protein 149 [Eumeta japonica]|uniref:Coiled-coil domain-containing protein 149 n=1 Tax=Eumeta variegata TaxID=151549 RepID=A0A4C1YZR2_EUMVA|nr:Coiled-coil domain-containing protein 149 [Eumeta japonica]